MKFSYNLSIEAQGAAEADLKANALAALAANLDGRTLSAMARKVPAILANPVQSTMIRKALGI